MKAKNIIMAFFLVVLAIPIFAEDAKPCDEYYFSCTVHDSNHTMEYSVVGWQHIEEPYVDSVWIVDAYNPTTIILVSYIQPRERIDISSVPSGRYLCYAQVGECTFARTIMPRNGPRTDVEETQTNSNNQLAPSKFFRDGQLLIEKNGKTYTIQGAQVK